jgi:hypothetical protein
MPDPKLLLYVELSPMALRCVMLDPMPCCRSPNGACGGGMDEPIDIPTSDPRVNEWEMLV